MELYTCILTENNCYKSGRRITPKGVMVHSTGANNPNLRRYVQPDDGRLGRNTGGNHWNQPSPGGSQVCVHAFVGRLADGSVGVYQTLPWDRRGWHCGRGEKGSANDTHIAFECCEDGLSDPVYFQSVYRAAVELTAYLCRRYHLDPLADGVVICHAEGHRRGIASNHGDVLHWWPRHGKTMDDFRTDVKAELEGGEEEVTQEQFDAMMDNYLQRRASRAVSGWAAPAMEKAGEAGITDGARPQGFATREEVAAMVVRGLELKEKELPQGI